jgi:hypothetical protein
MNYEALNRKQCFNDDINNIINNDINNVRTIDGGYCSLEKASNNRPNKEGNSEFDNSNENIIRKNIDNTKDNIKHNTNISIYRYKFTNEFIEDLYKFSKIHQYDHRKDFKEAWEKWVDENDLIISQEMKRLTELGYDGDILDKMFKSARYYFRKKRTEKKEPVARRCYIGTSKELIDLMDGHINKNISKEFKPSNGFEEFCKENIDLLKEEITRLIGCNIKDANEIKKKIKKTYKNRYFVIISK